MEKVVQEQLIEFLVTNNLIWESQRGFLKFESSTLYFELVI